MYSESVINKVYYVYGI